MNSLGIRGSILLAAGALLLGLASWVGGSAGPHAASAAGSAGTPPLTPVPTCGSLRQVSSPSIQPGDNNLNAVSGATVDDLWAVGYLGDAAGHHLLALHWDGSAWTDVTTPVLPPGENELHGVSARAANDVWAVGVSAPFTASQPLTEHWDGTIWRVVPGPSPPTSSGVLLAVSARAADDVWAVGNLGVSYPIRPLVEHWDGAVWRVVPSPDSPLGDGVLYSVAAQAPDDVWAVGVAGNPAYPQQLVEHWDGHAWSLVAHPSPGSDHNALHAVVALAANDVWAAGYYGFSGQGADRTLLEHWDGITWSVVPSPNVDPVSNYLTALAGRAAGDLWAAGMYLATDGTRQTLVEHWDGQSWTIVPSENRGRNSLNGIAALAPATVWTVGAVDGSRGALTLIEQYTGPCPPAGTATPTPLPTCPASWRVVNSPNNPTCGGLFGVSARMADDIWAVGSGGCDIATGGSLIEHWDGRAWQVVPSPQTDEILVGVVAIAANDAWAVGVGDTSEPPLIEHWDGTRWTQVASPVSAGGLEGIAAVSPTDIWAVGGDDRQRDDRPLVLHWDGVRWSIVPTYAGLGVLSGVVALTAQNIWAVGTTGFGVGAVIGTLVEHWDGTSWRQVPSPNPDPTYSALHQVVAVTPNDLWAVGTVNQTSPQTLIMHWDGGAWRQVTSPSLAPASRLWSIAASGRDDLWAVGDAIDYAAGRGGALLLHWDGVQWSAVPSPGLGPSYASLWGVVALAGHDVWAVGNHVDRSANPVQTLVERYVDNGTFSDVPASVYFYPAVHYLACAGVVAGYADGTFRPATPATRAQLSKIVVLAQGWPRVAGGAHFSDVPPSSPFYAYIETAYGHGVISGYGDGTFHPNAAITRAQLCKMQVLAQGWAISAPGGPHFSDVSPASPFYGVIETAYNHGLVSGYGDGSFHPAAAATRGQIAKIVYNAVRRP